MNDEFDELFNKFFGNDKDPFKDMRDYINKLNDYIESDTTNPYEDDLGEPDSVVRYEENGYTFEKKMWEVEGGTIIKVEMISSPLDVGFSPKKGKNVSLEDRLVVAIEEERYEDAAKIRDEIKARDTKGTEK